METVACPDCDLLQTIPELPAGGKARCSRCACNLAMRLAEPIDLPLALTITAAIVFIVANSFPLMSLSAVGRFASTTIMTKNPDKGFVPIKGFEDGQVSYQGKVSPDKIFTFYQEVMEAKGWQPNTFFGPRENQIAYTKGNRVVLIAFTPNPDGTTVLTVMVGTQYPPK